MFIKFTERLLGEQVTAESLVNPKYIVSVRQSPRGDGDELILLMHDGKTKYVAGNMDEMDLLLTNSGYS